VTDILSDYAEERGPQISSGWRIGYAIDALAKHWEGRAASEVTRKTCEAYVRRRGKSAGTARRELGVLRAVINHAHREGRINRPVAVYLPDRPEPKGRWLTRKEAARLLRESLREPRVRLHLPLFIVLGLYTGQRKEAILSLRWAQVDLEYQRINFNPPGRRQTNKRRAHLPIPPRLLPHLRRARLRGSDLGFVISRNGMKLADIKRSFSAACRRAELTGVSPHTLRHTCATWLTQRGVDKWEAASECRSKC
jgi:integrase